MMINHPLKVLIVDDVAICAEEIRDTYLSQYDCIVKIVLSYVSAVDELRDNKYNLMLLDYRLTVKNGCVISTGMMIRDDCLKNHNESRIIVYTGAIESVPETDRVNCVDRKDLGAAINKEIFYLSQPKNDDEKPVTIIKESEMPKLPKINYSVLITVVLLITATVIGYDRTRVKVDSTEAKLLTHCADDMVYREKLAIKIEESKIATARLEEQTKSLTKAVDELIREMKKK